MLELSKNVTMHRAKLLQAAPNQCCIGMAYELRSAVCCEEFTDAYLHKVKLKTKNIADGIFENLIFSMISVVSGLKRSL